VVKTVVGIYILTVIDATRRGDAADRLNRLVTTVAEDCIGGGCFAVRWAAGYFEAFEDGAAVYEA